MNIYDASHNLAILLSIYKTETHAIVREKTSARMLTTALFTIAQLWKQATGAPVPESHQVWNIHTAKCYTGMKYNHMDKSNKQNIEEK